MWLVGTNITEGQGSFSDPSSGKLRKFVRTKVKFVPDEGQFRQDEVGLDLWVSFWSFVRNSSGVRPDEVSSGSDFKCIFWSLSLISSLYYPSSPIELFEGDSMDIHGDLCGLLSDERSKNGFLILAARRSFSMVRFLRFSIFVFGGFSRVWPR